MNKILFFAATLLSMLQIACQYPVNDATLPDPQKFIVINAELTENYGKVRVTYTLTNINQLGGFNIPPDPTATAYVLDSHGNRTDFLTNGMVDTTFHGVVGETYQLYVQVEGVNYESTAETLRACPAIDSISTVYTRESFRSPNDFNFDGFDIYANLQDNAGEENYYQWDWVHYRRATACDKKFNNAEQREVLYPCNPYDCWTILYNPNVVVQSDHLRDGRPLSQKVTRVPFIRPPYKYYLRVEQRSITPAVFAYLQSVQTQTQQVGTLFDLPAETKFSPNIINVSTPSEQILGVFNVFSYRSKVIYVDRGQNINGIEARLNFDATPFVADPFSSAPCTEGLYRTQKRPEGWVD